MNAGEVLGEGWRLFLRGLITVFPWILAAELLQLLPFFGASGSLLTADLARWFAPASLFGTVAGGAMQAWLYSIAIVRLSQLDDDSPATGWRAGLRSVPAVFIGYLVYELIVIVGLIVALLFFVLGCWIGGLWGGLILCLLPLAPTAWASTAFALFAFSAVLEQRGPFASLKASRRRVLGNWGRATLVISVPALALLALWVAENPDPIFKTIPGIFVQLANPSADDAMAQLQSLQATMETQTHLSAVSPLQIALTAIGAFVWWYTLAVLYAEYRALGAERRG